MPRHRFKHKVNFKLCDTCPNLEFCCDFPYLPLGHHPAGKCPDGFMEKVFEWERPGPKYRQAKYKYADFVARPYRNDLDKWCIICAICGKGIRISRASKYWLCQRHIKKVLVPWKRKNHVLIDKFRGKIRQGYVYVFKIREKLSSCHREEKPRNGN